MLIWLALVLLLLVLQLVLGPQDTKKKQKKYLIISGTAVALVMGLRYPQYSLVSDLKTYVDFYELIGRTPWQGIFELSKFEYGYVLLNKVLASVVPWRQFIVIFEAAFCVFCAARFIYRNSDHAFHGMLFYVTLGTMTFQLTGFRQALAMSVCLLSVESIKDRKPTEFVLLVLLAATFHRTAIVFLPAYLLVNRKPTFTNSMASVGLMLVGVLGGSYMTVLGNSLFDMEYGRYVHSDIGGLIPILIYLALILVSYWQRGRLRSWIGLNMSIIGLAVYLARYATLALERMSFYFTPGAIIALPEAINSERDPNLRAAMQLISVSAAIGLFAYRLTMSEWAAYRFFWQ